METQDGSPFVFVGNNMALDFVNTEVVSQGQRISLLLTFANLVSWLRESAAIDAPLAEKALARWNGTQDASEALAQALALRAELRAMAQQIAQDQSIPTAALDGINATLRRRHGYTQVAPQEGGYRRLFHLEAHHPDDLLVPIAEAAGDLICYTDLSLIRKCENPKCILYFADTSKNHARRWCSMSLCGNRAKVAAHYRRVREAAG